MGASLGGKNSLLCMCMCMWVGMGLDGEGTDTINLMCCYVSNATHTASHPSPGIVNRPTGINNRYRTVWWNDKLAHYMLCRDRARQDQHVLIHLTVDDVTGERSYWVVPNVTFRSLVELIDMYQCTALTTKEGDEITLTVPLMPVWLEIGHGSAGLND